MIRGRPPRSTAVALLQAQGLPVSDITEKHLEDFFFVGSDSSPTGLVGLELYGADALLRSLGSVYLLTTTAETFFKRLGYERVNRSQAPPAIKGTREFASLCPASSASLPVIYETTPCAR